MSARLSAQAVGSDWKANGVTPNEQVAPPKTTPQRGTARTRFSSRSPCTSTAWIAPVSLVRSVTMWVTGRVRSSPSSSPACSG